MQFHVEQAEVDLPERVAALPEGPGAEQAVDDFVGKRFVRLVVTGQTLQRPPVVTPVFHELAGDLHRVPFHVGYAGRHAVVDGGQHVLKRVAELVEQRFHFAERHERGLAADGFALVADHVGHGQPGGLSRRSHDRASAHERIHPRAALLLRGTAVRVQVEGRHGFAPVVEHPEELDVLVPDRRLAGRFLQAHAEQALRQFEQSIQHAWQREIRSQFLVLQVVARLAKPFRPVRDVPMLEFANLVITVHSGQRLQRFHVPLGGAAARRAQFVEQAPHRTRVRRHFPAEAQRRKGIEPKQSALVDSQGDDLPGYVFVVPLSVRRLGNEGAVHALAQVPTLAVLHERHETGVVQREHPGSFRCRGLLVALLPGRIRGQFEQGFGQSFGLFGLRELDFEGLGGVEDVVGKLRAQLRQPLADLVVTFPVGVVQAHAVQFGLAYGRLQDPLLGRRVTSRFPAVPQGAIGLVQGLALAEAIAELDHFGEQGIVHLPQLG